MLRCREGDLAVILRPGSYLGHMITVGRFLGCVPAVKISTGDVDILTNAWEIHGVLKGHGVAEADKNLQPIRPAPSGVTMETKKEITA